MFNCFTHCGGGNVIDFVAKMEECEFREADEKLHEWFLADASGSVKEQDQKVGDREEAGLLKPSSESGCCQVAKPFIGPVRSAVRQGGSFSTTLDGYWNPMIP